MNHKKSKNDLLFLCNPCRTCIANPFECGRKGRDKDCGYLKNWNELLEYIESLEKALDKACYELGVLDNTLLDDRAWKDWLFGDD